MGQKIESESNAEIRDVLRANAGKLAVHAKVTHTKGGKTP
jgi:hypothetical protein